MTLEILKKSIEESSIIKKGNYSYLVNPLTDGIPSVQPQLLQETINEMKNRIKKFFPIDKILTIEAMGIPLASALSLEINIPYVIVRKRPYNLPNEIIINQKTGNIIYIAPYFSVDYSSSVDISFDAVNFSDNTGNKHTKGHGNSPILLEYIGKNVSTINNVDTIDIATDYKSAWHNYLNSTLSDSGLTYGSANDYIITENDNEISVDFNDALIVNLYIKVIEINFQIGPGWIIS